VVWCILSVCCSSFVVSGSRCDDELETANSELVFLSLKCIGTGAVPLNSKKRFPFSTLNKMGEIRTLAVVLGRLY
jgi:hypothetical protein